LTGGAANTVDGPVRYAPVNHLQWVRYCCTKMVFLKEDKILIKSL